MVTRVDMFVSAMAFLLWEKMILVGTIISNISAIKYNSEGYTSIIKIQTCERKSARNLVRGLVSF